MRRIGKKDTRRGRRIQRGVAGGGRDRMSGRTGSTRTQKKSKQGHLKVAATKAKAPASEGGRYKVIRERNGARKRTRTSTTVRPLAPEASASASSAIRAQGKQQAGLILGWETAFVNEGVLPKPIGWTTEL
jgi:hypothetical protein